MPSQQSQLTFSAATRKRNIRSADKAETPVSARSPRDSANTLLASTATLTSALSQSPDTTPTSLNAAMQALPDSTDWLATSLPSFEPLEAALRCEVCKEFYENPVVTTCSHTFCSLCIRRCITNDGKCPACKSPCQADRLIPNYTVREIVSQFQNARPAALALARQKTEAEMSRTSKKRTVEEADFDEADNRRQTRSRTTRSSSQRGNGIEDAPIEVADSEDDDDEQYIPEGMVACPICRRTMKEESVWPHLSNGKCPGEQTRPSGRSRRARPQNMISNRNPPPPPSKLPGLNYALLKDAALKKKLQELGIPHWGKRDLQIRRHTEWVHLWNSNCDASEDNRKTKGELLRELTNWERTRGGWANTSDAPVMRKDFDAKGHIEAHKSQFNELIAAARKKKPSPKEDEKREDAVIQGSSSEDVLMTKSLERSESAAETESKDTTNVLRPYEGNESALLSIREKVQETNLSGNIQAPQHGNEATLPKMNSDSAHSVHTGMQDPFTSPSKRLPMFAVPKEPVMEVEKP